ncbi:MAG: DUF86 domain-containing protein [Planctomycetes bacterium]|nr:DUF86 domain-containing protein [Planctomycetota bacterium]
MIDIARGKIRDLRDHVRRLREVDPGTLEALRADLLRQESILLNLQRACQAAIDLALALVASRGIGPAADSRDAFRRLADAAVLTAPLAERLQAMVGFRNLAAHRYSELDLRIVRAVLDGRLDDLLDWATAAEVAIGDRPAG